MRRWLGLLLLLVVLASSVWADILASDTFTRADDGTGLGANWTKGDAGNFYHLAGNAAQIINVSVPVLDRYTAITWPDDQYVKVTLATLTAASDEGVGPACRMSAIAQTAYFAQANTTEIKLYRVVAGAFQQLGSDAAGAAVNDVIELDCVGTAISVKKNGATVIGPEPDVVIAAGSAGLWGYQASGTVAVDNFEGGDFAGGQATTTPSRSLTGVGT